MPPRRCPVLQPFWARGHVKRVSLKRGHLEHPVWLKALRLIQLERQVRFDRDEPTKHRIVACGPGDKRQPGRQGDREVAPPTGSTAKRKRQYTPGNGKDRVNQAQKPPNKPQTTAVRHDRSGWPQQSPMTSRLRVSNTNQQSCVS